MINNEITNFFDRENKIITELIYQLKDGDIKEIRTKYPKFNPQQYPLLYSEFISLDVQNCILKNIKYKYVIHFEYKSILNDQQNNNHNQYQGVEIKSSFDFYVGSNDIFKQEFNIKLILSRLLFFNQYLPVKFSRCY